MKSLSLKWKVIWTGLVPLLFFLAIAGYQIHTRYQTMEEAKVLKARNAIIALASAVVNETQKERGRTAIFLSGGSDLKPLNKQRAVNDEKIEVLKKALDRSTFEKAYNQEILSAVESIEGLREQVNAKKIELPSALKAYTGIVSVLLGINLKVAGESQLQVVASDLRSLRILEDAKESGGKLRANMSAILSKNKAISDKKFAAILKLKAGVDTNLSSSALSLSDQGKKRVEEFMASSDWKTVNQTFQLILKNSDQGGYYTDASKFFGIISGALNIVGQTINGKKEEIGVRLDQIIAKAQADLFLYGAILGVLLAGITFFIFRMVNLASESINTIKKIAEGVAHESQEAMQYSHSISAMSGKLSEASYEQAASLQETVSSIDEISSMVQRNAETANSSTKISSVSQEAAVEGKKTVESMVSSMQEISSSNDEIMEEVLRSNSEITKIVEVIAEIGEKTKVINDIVFQTKLLSFNASVEAARAGEHGKGFAVVAEEVGNLASMSGKAAHEITEMLDRSIKQVTAIVEDAKSKVERLMKAGKEKVDTGLKKADLCGESLTKILKNVVDVNEMIREIASASSEQSMGVQEITKAMQQLDNVTHQNTSIAQESAQTSEKMLKQAEDLNDSIEQMMQVIDGKSHEESFEKKHTVDGNASEAQKPQSSVVPMSQFQKKVAPPAGLKKAAGSSLEEADPFENGEFEDL